MALASKGRVLFYRGRTEEAAAIASDLLPRARAAADAQIVLPTLSLAALVEPRPDAALALVTELLAVDDPLYPDSARVCVRHGATELAQRMIRTDERAAPRTRHVGVTVRAILAEHAGDADEAARLYVEAAERWQRYPFVLERAQCLLGAARCLLARGRNGGVREQVEEARKLFRSLGAEPLELEAAELLDRVAA